MLFKTTELNQNFPKLRIFFWKLGVNIVLEVSLLPGQHSHPISRPASPAKNRTVWSEVPDQTGSLEAKTTLRGPILCVIYWTSVSQQLLKENPRQTEWGISKQSYVNYWKVSISLQIFSRVELFTRQYKMGKLWCLAWIFSKIWT